MNIIKTVLLLFFIKITIAYQNYKEASKSKNPLPYFRRKAEGIQEISTIEPLTEDKSSNLVSFLVKNVKEIFDDIVEGHPVTRSTTKITPEDFTPTLTSNADEEISLQTHTNDVMLYENLSLTTLLDNYLFTSGSLLEKADTEHVLKSQLMQLTKEMKSFEKTDLRMGTRDKTNLTISSDILTTERCYKNEERRSCVFCNNILIENCYDPQNKLIPTVMCERDGDLCYSQHTPFGIIDRGCFNINHNITTYVCSCNLCNYISISEMPYIFSNKKHWVDNIIELSRSRNLRKSVFKNMSCLRCEVNTTKSTGDMLDSANCLEGNIGYLPIQDCEQNEVCAVRAVRSHGYIWRGCVTFPLYNYWLALCDSDLCNYDPLLSIYDLVNPSTGSAMTSIDIARSKSRSRTTDSYSEHDTLKTSLIKHASESLKVPRSVSS